MMVSKRLTLFVVFVMLLSSFISPVFGENGEDNNTLEAIPFVTSTGEYHLFTLHEVWSGDYGQYFIYHQMRTDDQWSAPKRFPNEMLDGANVFLHDFRNLVDIYETDNGIEIVYFLESSDSVEYYSIKYISSKGEWTNIETLVSNQEFYHALELPDSESSDSSIFGLEHHSSAVYSNGDLITTWSYYLSSSRDSPEKFVTLYRSADGITNLFTMNVTFSVINQVYFSDQVLYYSIFDGYSSNDEYIIQYNITSGTWVNKSCIGCNFYPYSVNSNDPSKFFYEAENTLMIYDAVRNETREISPIVNVKHFKVRSKNFDLIDILVQNTTGIYWKIYDVTNKLLQTRTVLEEASNWQLDKAKISTGSFTVITWTDDFELSEYQEQIYGIEYVDDQFSIPKQITHATDYTDDYFPGGQIAFIGSPFLELMIISGFALYSIRRLKIHNFSQKQFR